MNTTSTPSTAAIATRSRTSGHRNGRQAASVAAGIPDDLATLEGGLSAFLRGLEGLNRSPLTIRAYRTDLGQFLAWLHATNVVARTPAGVVKADVSEYLTHLARRGITGLSRARTLSAVRRYFAFLVDEGAIARSPAAGVETPTKEKNTRTWLRPEEYRAMLAHAGGSPRDYAILQVFLQTGVRVSELCDLRLRDVDLANRVLTVRGKGRVERVIELERRGVQAIRSWLAIRPHAVDDRLFLNYRGEPLGERGVRKLVVKYRRAAGIARHATPHSFRHTFGTLKAQQGVSPYRLKEWLGHAKLDTTQIYVHLARTNAGKEMEATSL
jgi:integrase/recombinase XerC